jgi:hypothetical protein
MADSSESPRKTLDDIRRELDAEYPVESEAETPVLVAQDDYAVAVECSSSVAGRRAPGRRHAMVAGLGGIAVSLLLIAGYVVVHREPVRLNAVASVREIIAQPVAPVVSSAALGELERELKALRADLKALADRLERWDSRIGGMESRVQGVESSMRRRADDAAPAAAPRPAKRTAAAPRPHDVPPAEELVLPPEAPTPPPTTTDVAESRQASADPDVPPTLRQKLRAEWRTIKQGFAGAGDDFKAVMRDFTRKVAGE